MSAEWTFLVYMAADNDLESAAKETLEDMSSVTMAASVNVVVELDTFEERMQRLLIRDGKINVLADGPGVDMGDPAVLTQFVDWGLDTFPARYSALTVWDHGGGWEDPAVDPLAFARPRPTSLERPPTTAPRIADDYHSADYLTDQELRQAIEQTKRGCVDVFGCDACFMSMIEIAYEMRHTAGFMVASEAKQSSSWAYGRILAELASDPGMSPGTLASGIVTAYAQQDGAGTRTLAAMDLANLEPLCDDVDALAGALLAPLKTRRGKIVDARTATSAYGTFRDYLDLADLLAQFSTMLDDTGVMTAAAQVKTSLARFLTSATPVDTSSKGLSIFFPDNGDGLLPYGGLAFAREHRWGGFLRAFFATG